MAKYLVKRIVEAMHLASDDLGWRGGRADRLDRGMLMKMARPFRLTDDGDWAVRASSLHHNGFADSAGGLGYGCRPF